MFYVYELVDPRDSRIFYIGKGQGIRMWQHEKDALATTVKAWGREVVLKRLLAHGVGVVAC